MAVLDPREQLCLLPINTGLLRRLLVGLAALLLDDRRLLWIWRLVCDVGRLGVPHQFTSHFLKRYYGRNIIAISSGSNRKLGQRPLHRRKVATMKANFHVGTAFTAVAMAAAYIFVSPSDTFADEGASLLVGKVVASNGEALAG